MQKYANSVQDTLGNAISVATVTVYTDSAHTALATIYSDNGITPTTNPRTTDSLGEFSFYAADGRYYIKVSKSGITTQFLDDVILFDPTASGSSGSINFVPSGTGAVSRAVQTKLREWVSVTDFGALGDGSTDDATAFTNAMAAAYNVFVPNPSVGYKLGSKLTIPTSTVLWGAGKHTCKLLHSYNGTFCELGSQAGLVDLYIEGQGATYTGKGIVMSVAGNGKQRIHCCKVINFASACIAFDDIDAGSQFSGLDIETYQVSGGTGTGNYAITVVDGVQLAATPRAFHQIESGGNCAFSFGGSNDTFITDSFLGDLAYTANSRSVHIGHSRLANQTALTINGANHSIVGCDVLAVVTLSATTNNCSLGPNSWNTSPYVTDSSAVGTNLICHSGVTYTPTWTAVSVNPAISNGTIAGWYTRNGNVINATISISMGSGTTFGTGEYSFSLPLATTVGSRNQIGSVQGLRSGVSYVAGSCVLSSGGNSVKCYSQGGATAFKESVPHTWASGDNLNISIQYVV